MVDDKSDAADTTAELLSDLGYSVEAIYDPLSALELVRTFRPQVCLLDKGLPVIDG